MSRDWLDFLFESLLELSNFLLLFNNAIVESLHMLFFLQIHVIVER